MKNAESAQFTRSSFSHDSELVSISSVGKISLLLQIILQGLLLTLQVRAHVEFCDLIVPE